MNKLDAFQIRYGSVMGTIAGAHIGYSNGGDAERILRTVISEIRSTHQDFLLELESLPACDHDEHSDEWQKCPVCEGTGYVAYPHGTAAGQSWGSTDCSNKPCHRCGGSGTIVRPDLAHSDQPGQQESK